MFGQKKLVVHCLIFVFLIRFIFGGSRSAWGHTFDNYGFGSRAIAMGSAMVGFDDQYTAVYYNPAGMAFHEGKDENLGFSFLYTVPELKINGSKPKSQTGGKRIYPDEGISVGYATPLGSGKIAEMVSYGLGVYAPYPVTLYIVELKSFDPSVPYFVQYENRNRFLIVTGAVSYKAWKKLAFAAGIDLMLGIIPLNANVGIGKEVKIGIDGRLPLDLAPTAGIQYRPTDWLSLGAAYHGKTQVKVVIPANINLPSPSSETIPLLVTFRDVYKPHQVEMGFGVKPLKGLLISGALSWVNFADYVPPVLEIKLNSNSPLTGSMEKLLNQFITTYNYEFKDYWIPRFGVEYKVTSHLDARAGYFYRNSSVPAQIGDTSFIDPPTHGIGAGIGISFSDPLDIIPNPVKVDFAYQGHFLQKVTVTKASTANQSYYAGGSCHLVTGTLMYFF